MPTIGFWWSNVIIASEFSVKPSAALLTKISLQRGCCDEHKSMAEKDGGVGEDRLKSRPHLPKGWYAFDGSVWVSDSKPSGKTYVLSTWSSGQSREKRLPVMTSVITLAPLQLPSPVSHPGAHPVPRSPQGRQPRFFKRPEWPEGMAGWSCQRKTTHLHR